MIYSIEFNPAKGLNTDPEPWNFEAPNQEEACAKICNEFCFNRPLTERKLKNFSVKKVTCDGKEISLRALTRNHKMDETQEKLLAIVETWNLSDKPEFRGFRCADCQQYFTGQAFHYLLHEGDYLTPVHFCETCQATFKNSPPTQKPRVSVDREHFIPLFRSRTHVELSKISHAWDITAPQPVLKAFTCDACKQPLSIIDGRPQGWHVWRNQDGILIEYHFDVVCWTKISPTK